MNRSIPPQFAAACGIAFPIVLFVAVGDGTSFAPWRAIASAWALVLFLPFLAYLTDVLRRAEGDDGWLSTVALVTGVCGVLLKLTSHVPELAIHHDNLTKGTPLYRALDDMAGAATTLSLYPWAACVAAVGAIVLHTGVLPRWTGVFALLTAATLAVNAGFIYAGFVPGLLVFLLWTIATSLVLLRRGAELRQVAYAT
jgi:hypothetical protein